MPATPDASRQPSATSRRSKVGRIARRSDPRQTLSAHEALAEATEYATNLTRQIDEAASDLKRRLDATEALFSDV